MIGKRGIVAAGLSPHPPIAVPYVGRGEERKISKTLDSLDELVKSFMDEEPDTLLVITPHGPVFSDAVCIRNTARLCGSLKDFGAPDAIVDFENDSFLVGAISKEAQKIGGFETLLLHEKNLSRYRIDFEMDHGSSVPLWFFKNKGYLRKAVIVNIGFLPYLALYEFGMAIDRAAKKIGRKIAVLASGDLSHSLTDEAPSGFNPKGPLFDKVLMQNLGEFDVPSILFLPEDLVEGAAQCGLRPIAMLLGALDKYQVQPKVLSYEGPFGVGYGVAFLKITGDLPSRFPGLEKIRLQGLEKRRRSESYPVFLARSAVESFVKYGSVRPFFNVEDVPPEFLKRGGVFVSIKKDGVLRGCIGTTQGNRPSVAQEIVSNAVSACSKDPRFGPVRDDELPFLQYSVDILSDSELVSSMEELDPKKYGVIVEKGGRRGLLLPDLAGVDTAKEQIEIAKEKAGIFGYEKKVDIYRFTVTRFF